MTDSTDDDLSLRPMNPTRRSVSVGDSPMKPVKLVTDIFVRLYHELIIRLQPKLAG